MKYAHYAIACLLCLVPSYALHAQEYEIQVHNTKQGKLTLINFPGDLPIEGYSGNKIIITSDIATQKPARAKDLKAVYADGTDNTGIAVATEKKDNQVTIRCLLPIRKSGHYKIKVPNQFSIQVNKSCARRGEITVSNIQGEVDIKSCSGIKINNVSGSLVLSTIHGDITVSFATLSKDKAVSLASISGDIDVAIPSSTGMDVELKNISGSTYSNFSFSSDDKGLSKIGGKHISGKINGGGANITITNVKGNVYLRKR